ncbi:TIGR04282 family arsenosugar biosynthesis glycosyltransferase [Methylotuvimicrobium sp.]|uniref:TIGR04282 family arsenosugar biosynthesis glycosyltransferase n=1 Tax=Methylotuvimicrobium sp. TaxID=2822413 RepID=UPI003D6568D3
MAARGAIALFVKTPGLSPIKTRLAVKLGTDRAEQFHWQAARSTVAVIKQAEQSCELQGYYAVAEEIAATNGIWRGMPCLWQGEGGLGERMRHVYEHLIENHDFVMLVGADIPQMTVTDLQQASSWLEHEEQARFAYGPSLDGGFWLFGGNCSLLGPWWTDVEYSTADTGAQFFNAVKQWGEVQTLRVLQDVDESSDLLVLHKALQALASPVPEQVQLMRFLYGLTPELTTLDEGPYV